MNVSQPPGRFETDLAVKTEFAFMGGVVESTSGSRICKLDNI